MDDGSELFDVVDGEDRVIGQATRREVHQKQWMHRSVHVLVFNREGQLFLQKRALTKDENPGFWDTSAAGHVDSGEDYATCAVRETFEELGIRANLEYLFKISARPETFWEHVQVFRCATEEPIVINPLEIDEGRFWSLTEIQSCLETGSPPMTSTFRMIFSMYLK